MQMLLTWLILSVAVSVTAAIVPGFEVRGFKGAVKVAALFGLINWAIGWLIYFAIGIGTLGIGFLFAFLTRWLVNAIVLKITDSLSDSLTIDRFRTALIGALLMSGIGTLGEMLIR